MDGHRCGRPYVRGIPGQDTAREAQFDCRIARGATEQGKILVVDGFPA